ncbi:MAG: hypothetical protein WEB53_13935 [Akkermansiaceae bacterium]
MVLGPVVGPSMEVAGGTGGYAVAANLRIPEQRFAQGNSRIPVSDKVAQVRWFRHNLEPQGLQDGWGFYLLQDGWGYYLLCEQTRQTDKSQGGSSG